MWAGGRGCVRGLRGAVEHVRGERGGGDALGGELADEGITAAGRTVFGRDGLNASMASVAREAGVGIATLLRHFPTKEELVAAVFADRMDAYADAVAQALDDPSVRTARGLGTLRLRSRTGRSGPRPPGRPGPAGPR